MRNIVIALLILIVLGGGYFLFFGNNPSETGMEMQVNQETPKVPAATPSPKPTQPLAPAVHAVEIRDFSFSPSNITLKKGDTIVWTNKDAAPHTVTWDGGGQNSSGTLKSGETFSFVFTGPGTFNYHCAFHPSMKGKVIVQ